MQGNWLQDQRVGRGVRHIRTVTIRPLIFSKLLEKNLLQAQWRTFLVGSAQELVATPELRPQRISQTRIATVLNRQSLPSHHIHRPLEIVVAVPRHLQTKQL